MTENETNYTYKGVTIKRNEFGSFNVNLINCFGAPSLDSAMRAIDKARWSWGASEKPEVK